MHDNIDSVCVFIKLLKMRISDEILQTEEHHYALLSLNFHQNHGVATIDNSTEHRCYLVFNRVRGKFVREGSASSEFGHRGAKGVQVGQTNDRIKASRE